MNETYDKGLTVGELVRALKKLPQGLPFKVACDEEQNTVFNGYYVAHYEDCVLIAGLSGTEDDV